MDNQTQADYVTSLAEKFHKLVDEQMTEFEAAGLEVPKGVAIMLTALSITTAAIASIGTSTSEQSEDLLSTFAVQTMGFINNARDQLAEGGTDNGENS